MNRELCVSTKVVAPCNVGYLFDFYVELGMFLRTDTLCYSTHWTQQKSKRTFMSLLIFYLKVEIIYDI